jgi:MEDS: MEthanogen/methylotroph, DcmR Sensory domain
MTEASSPTDSMLRHTGIPIVEGIPWGTHICVFYETKEDLLETAVSYFKAGLESSESCVWAVSPPISEEDATKLLRQDVPNFDARMSAGQIEILQGYEWYLKGHEFDPKLITAGWSEKLDDALAEVTRA